MSTTVLTGMSQQTRTIQSWRPLGRVVTWEIRRFCASRLFLVQAFGFFCVSFLLTWALHAPENFGGGVVATGSSPGAHATPLSGFVAGTSARGLLDNLPIFLVVLVLFLPFIVVDGVTRDQQRRTHELILTSALPTRAYVWGRYLTGLLVSVAMALLMLVAMITMGWLLHLTVTDYPAPEIGNLIILWVGMVLSAAILVSGLGFALGTLFPHLSTLIKVVILVAWIFGGVVIPLGLGNSTPSHWAMNWDPTSGLTGKGLLNANSPNLFGGILGPSTTTETQLQHALLAVENKLPPLAGWFGPHLLLAGLSILLVLIAALAFKRSREVLN